MNVLSLCCLSMCTSMCTYYEPLNTIGFVSVTVFSPPGDYPAPRAVLTGHDHEVVCVSVCAELGLVISGAKG